MVHVVQPRTDDSRVAIRAARLEDIEAIIGLWGGMMADHERGDARLRLAPGAISAYRAYVGYHLTNAESKLLVAEAEGKIVAFSLTTISRNLPMFLPARFGYISDLVVASHARREGIGRRMVEETAAWLRAHRIDSIQLQYYCFNELGEAFWRERGFEPFYTRAWLSLE
jgi:ribosomal protein S18 acetylase RimI-like enzyme